MSAAGAASVVIAPDIGCVAGLAGKGAAVEATDGGRDLSDSLWHASEEELCFVILQSFDGAWVAWRQRLAAPAVKNRPLGHRDGSKIGLTQSSLGR
jgi:uncharacterized cupin superfamily protein